MANRELDEMETEEEEAPTLLEESSSSKKNNRNEDESDAEEQEEDDGDEEEAKDVTAQVRNALFAAVEGGGDDGDTDDDEDVHSHRPLMRLFTPSQSSRSIKPRANARELKELILDTIKGFHKGYARRFFAGLGPIVKRVIEEDEYVPESAYQDEDENDDNFSYAADEIEPDPKSSKALKFLLYTIQILQAFLDASIDKQSAPKSRRSSHAGKSISIISEAIQVAELLHEILLSLHGCGPDAVPVQSALLTLLENWWLANATQRDSLILQALPLLVLKALGVEGKPAQKSDIKRLLRVQDAFRQVDFNDDSSDTLRSLLLKVASSPLCLKLNEGKRFVSGLFLLDPSLVSYLHRAMKIQMPQSKRPILRIYGEIYMKAWTDSQNNHDCPEEIQAAIEEDVLQDLMYAALHIQNPRMSKILLLVLEPFHENKKNEKIASLLYRMYGPILWRALTAANPQVRINAASVLTEVFPLQEPSHSQADATYKRGAAAVKALLKDKNPKVRVAGSETAAKVLGNFWDVLATDDIRTLLNHIMTKHASDSSSYQVRAGALKAITVLLDSPKCHAVLRALLPSLGNLVHDKHKIVRLAAVNMLLKVKTTDTIKYYHVVPFDHLKARLADEGRQSSLASTAYNPVLFESPVASALTGLLLNSIVPQGAGVSAVDQIKRTLTLLSTDPDAAAVFYANLADHLNPIAIAKLASMLLKCLAAAIDTEKKEAINTSQKTEASGGSKKRNRRSGDDSDSEGTEDESDSEESDIDIDDSRTTNNEAEVTLTASNTSLMAILSEVMASLWESILDELDYPENEGCQKMLVNTFSGTTLTDILGHFEQRALANQGKGKDGGKHNDYCRVRSAILRCAGFLEPTDVEGLVSHITKSLQALSSNSKKARQLTESIPNHFALLCLWGMTEDVASSLSASITAPFDEGDDSTLLSLETTNSENSKKRKSSSGGRRKSSSKNSMIPLLPPEVAIEVLNEILLGSDPGNVTAREAIMESGSAREKLEEAFDVTTQYTGRFFRAAAVQSQPVNDGHFLLILKVCEAFGRFILHKAGSTSIEEGTMMELNLEAKHLLEWTTDQILPALLTEGKGIPLQELDLSRISFNDSIVSMELDETLETDPPTPRLTPLAPPRKKPDLKATPERLDGSFEPSRDAKAKRKDSKVIPGDSTAMMIRCASSSLLQNVCHVFSEWLLVGAGSGAQEIGEAALNWCRILDAKSDEEEEERVNDENTSKDKENEKDNDDKLKTFQLDLLPSFARLSATLGVTASNWKLLSLFLHKIPRLLDELDDQDGISERIEALVQDMVTYLLRVASSRDAAVDAILDFVYDNLQSIDAEAKSDEEDHHDKEVKIGKRHEAVDFPSTTIEVVQGPIEEYFSSRAVVVSAALHPIVMHKQGSLLLAERLWNNLHSNLRPTEGAGDGLDNVERDPRKQMDMLFQSKCLWYVSDSGACRKAAPFQGILRRIEGMDLESGEILGDGNPIGVFLKSTVEMRPETKSTSAVQEDAPQDAAAG